MLSCAAQHRTDRGQNLAELIVELAGNMPKRGFLSGNQFLRQVAALLGEFGEPRKNLAVAADEI